MDHIHTSYDVKMLWEESETTKKSYCLQLTYDNKHDGNSCPGIVYLYFAHMGKDCPSLEITMPYSSSQKIESNQYQDQF